MGLATRGEWYTLGQGRLCRRARHRTDRRAHAPDLRGRAQPRICALSLVAQAASVLLEVPRDHGGQPGRLLQPGQRRGPVHDAEALRSASSSSSICLLRALRLQVLIDVAPISCLKLLPLPAAAPSINLDAAGGGPRKEAVCGAAGGGQTGCRPAAPVSNCGRQPCRLATAAAGVACV